MRLLRLMWAPLGLLLRFTAWLLFAPLGVFLSWRKGRNRRHRRLVEATSQRYNPGGVIGGSPPTITIHPPPVPPPLRPTGSITINPVITTSSLEAEETARRFAEALHEAMRRQGGPARG